MNRWLLLLALFFTFPARADDISATGRGVVRIVTIASAQGQVIGFGHGSGFAVAPDKIVTNAHVVELAMKYPANVLIGVVPSEGVKSYQGKVIAYDPKRDLALIQLSGTRLPPAVLYAGPVSEGDPVISLGYPGNVDVATAQSSADYIKPLAPVRSDGVSSGRRTLTGTDVLLHTAAIARGNSGGPLLDRCGRVLGVNSALTRAEEGDASFGFAIANTELVQFLAEAKQPVTSVGLPCTSIEDRIARDRDADARAVEQSTAASRDAATRAEVAHQAALEQARSDAETRRENVMGLAALLLVASALVFGGAGLLEGKGRRRMAIWLAAGGAIGMLAAVILFVLRPDARAIPEAVLAVPPAAPLYHGKMTCSILPDRSRVTVSAITDVGIDWSVKGCMNGRTQYAEAGGGRWERMLVPDDEATVSILAFNPATRTYSNTRYMLSAPQMEQARKLRTGVELKTCTPDQGALNGLASQQTAIRDALPPLPNEMLVYSCKPG